MAAFEATQHTRGQAAVLVALGRAHTRAARYDLAQAQLQRAAKLYAKLDDADRYAEALELLGIAEAARGDVDAARRTLTDAGLAYRYAGAPQDVERVAGHLQELQRRSTLEER